MLKVIIRVQGQVPTFALLDQTRLLFGSLPSNQIVLSASGIEPIHGLLEGSDDDQWRVIDLDSSSGIKVNGSKINTEQVVQVGDTIEFGEASMTLAVSNDIEIAQHRIEAGYQVSETASNAPKELNLSPPVERRDENLLFSPRKAKPSGNILEVVAYWQGTILEVEHFHPDIKGYDTVTIGDPTKAHFLAANKDNVDFHKLAVVKENGFKLNLLPHMKGRISYGGKVESVKGGSYNLGLRDICHISDGEIRYFFLFMQPPKIVLPYLGYKDPFFLALNFVFMTLFLFSTIALWITEPKKNTHLSDDYWSIVNVVEKPKAKEPQKEIKKVEEVKVDPPKPTAMPKPPEKKVQPVKQIEPAKKPVEVPKEEKPKPTEVLTKKKEAPKVEKSEKNVEAAASPAKAKGGGDKKDTGAARLGTQKSDIKGVEGAKTHKASGVNLSQLGLGVGTVSSKTGQTAIYTNFKSSAGGAGAGAGSGAKMLGLGGIGAGASLALGGGGKTAQNFGDGESGVLNDKKGEGGLGKAFGGARKPTSVSVGAGDPLVSGGLSQNEILGVIRANLNQIRHCYETLLQREPGASGSLKVQFEIGLDGRVAAVNPTASTISDPTMKNCVLGVVQRWSFPKPRGGSPVQVNYPFTFNPI